MTKTAWHLLTHPMFTCHECVTDIRGVVSKRDRLIIAAPALLEALRALDQLWLHGKPPTLTDEAFEAMREQARAAIQLVEGEK